MKTKIILLLALIVMAGACKTTKKTGDALKMSNDVKYCLIMSFISKGEGTDKSLVAKLDALILTFNQKNETKVEYEKYSWGKEGEFDLCFPFKDVKKGLQKDFVKAVKNLTKSSTSVILRENETCLHKPKADK